MRLTTVSLTLLTYLATFESATSSQENPAEDLKKHFGVEAEYQSPEGVLRANWSLGRPEALKVFTPRGTEPTVQLGTGMSLAADSAIEWRELKFTHPHTVAVDVRLGDARGSFQVFLFPPGSEQTGINCFFNTRVEMEDGRSARQDGICAVEKGKPLGASGLAPTRLSSSEWVEVRMRVTELKVTLWVGGKRIGEETLPPPVFGVTLAALEGKVQLKNLRTNGRVAKGSLRKLVRSGRALDRPRSDREAEGLRARLMLINEERVAVGNRMLERLREGRLYRDRKRTERLENEELRIINEAVEAWNRGKHERAVERFREIARRYPGEVVVSYLIGRAQANAGRHEEAIRTYEEVVKRDPKCHQAWRAIGLHYLEAGEEAEAEVRLKKARRLASRDPWNIAFQGLLCLQWGEFSRARTKFEVAREARPDSEAIRLLNRHLKLLVKGPWGRDRHREKTRYYVIESNVGGKFVSRIGENLDRYREFLQTAFPLPRRKKKRSPVWIFDAEEEYMAFTATLSRRAEHSLGVYHSSLNTLLLFASLCEQQNLEVVFHEAFHQYLDTAVSDVPYWLNEGFAEYFGATRFTEDNRAVEGGILVGRLTGLKSHLEDLKEPVPFARIMQMNPRDFMQSETVGLHYAQSWSMVHFFRRGKNAPATAKFQAYVDALIAGKKAPEAYQCTFGNAKAPALDTLEDAWRRYLETELFPKL